MNLMRLTISAALIIGCSPQRIDLIPLAVGNVYEFKSIRTDSVESIVVAGMVRINGTEFYRLEGSLIEERMFPKYIAYDSLGNTLLSIEHFDSIKTNVLNSADFPPNGVSLWLLDKAKPGDYWIVFNNSLFEPALISRFTIMLEAESDTIRTEATTYFKCLKYSINMLNAHGDETVMWIERGVGPVAFAFGDSNDTLKLLNVRVQHVR